MNALVRWGKIGLGLYSMRDAVNAYMKACGADKIPFDGINGIREKKKNSIGRFANPLHCTFIQRTVIQSKDGIESNFQFHHHSYKATIQKVI